MDLRTNRGFTGVDVSVAIVILVLFVGIIASLIYKFEISSKEVDRKSEATYLAVQVIEGIKQMNYDDIKADASVSIEESTVNIIIINKRTRYLH